MDKITTTRRSEVVPENVKQSLRLGISALITCAIAMGFERIEYIWYPLLAVITVIDEEDENTMRAASARVLGTITGGMVTFVVHTIISGWPAILVSLLIIIPLLRQLGWSAGFPSAAMITIMFLAIPNYTNVDWNYIFNRSLDTIVGIFIAVLVCRLLWPKNRLVEMQLLIKGLQQQLDHRLSLLSQWLAGDQEAPSHFQPEAITRDILELQRLLNVEMAQGARHQKLLKHQGWPQRVLLWRSLHVRWIQVERLLERISRREQIAPQPSLSRYLEPATDIHGKPLDLGPAGKSIGHLSRVALEEEVTRLRLLMESQQRFERSHRR
ncbi:MAG: aromatic acid exporter family protein [Prochlorococcus sp.]|nr:FUSC family protein [Prochlorococcaceae cyanobacterium Fu_MAG_50]